MKNIIMILGLLSLTGCAGGRCLVTARSVQQPVSCTPCVLDVSGNIRTAQQNQVVRHITLSKTSWSMLWTGVPLGKTEWDLSPELNAKLGETPGNAIVNVRVKAQGGNLLHWYIAALVPVIPSYVDTTVEADIVNIPPARQ